MNTDEEQEERHDEAFLDDPDLEGQVRVDSAHDDGHERAPDPGAQADTLHDSPLGSSWVGESEEKNKTQTTPASVLWLNLSSFALLVNIIISMGTLASSFSLW